MSGGDQPVVRDLSVLVERAILLERLRVPALFGERLRDEEPQRVVLWGQLERAPEIRDPVRGHRTCASCANG
jgi:hypothetical protein